FQGPGVAYFEGGHVYESCGEFLTKQGEFVCNMPKGRGTYTWLDGSSYEGEVHNGIRHGTGTYKCAKTSVSYTGQWDQGKRHGQGVLYYNQDKTSWYNGDWVKNSREGWGMRRYPSGNIYCGEWKSNLRHGEGTMRWLNLDQHYVGMWEKGLQHGRGTHIWILRQATGSQSLMSNQYKGDFVQGQRHGQGTIYYACGATYEGEWSNNKSHGKVKQCYSFASHIQCTHVDSGSTKHDLHFLHAENLPLSSDMALNIDWLLDMVPQKVREPEREQVEFEMLIHSTQLRSVYKFYSRLGRAHSPHGAFLLTRLQLWRLLKDCNVHHHDITLIQIDRFIHSPFTPILLRRLLSCLVAVAYHLYHRDMGPQKNLLAACFSKLMTDNILPNATNVKGFLCRQPDCTEAALNYLQKCWEIYQTYCRVNRAPKDDRTMTCRDLLWMFQV
uniref:Radial spoke head 10 homolog B n=1 Tax=Mola mola TaxID=94237 RepID=A0A3Q4AHB1_MOLML